MSSRLCWSQINREQGSFGTSLKRTLGSWRFGGDGSCWSGDIILSAKDIPALEAMMAAGISEAKDLIEVIYKYDEVRLWLEY